LRTITFLKVLGCNLGKLFAAMEDKSGFKAYLGSCNDRSVDKCTQNGKGKVSQVTIIFEFTDLARINLKIGYWQVFAVDVFPIGAGVTLWKIESVAFVPNWISPLCIFNKDNQIRPGQNYSVHSTSVCLIQPCYVVILIYFPIPVGFEVESRVGVRRQVMLENRDHT